MRLLDFFKKEGLRFYSHQDGLEFARNQLEANGFVELTKRKGDEYSIKELDTYKPAKKRILEESIRNPELYTTNGEYKINSITDDAYLKAEPSVSVEYRERDDLELYQKLSDGVLNKQREQFHKNLKKGFVDVGGFEFEIEEEVQQEKSAAVSVDVSRGRLPVKGKSADVSGAFSSSSGVKKLPLASLSYSTIYLSQPVLPVFQPNHSSTIAFILGIMIMVHQAFLLTKKNDSSINLGSRLIEESFEIEYEVN